MARYIQPTCHLCRRVDNKLMLKGERCFTSKCVLEKRNNSKQMYRSTKRRRPRKSDRGLQLLEKQKARYTYGIMEKQFRRIFAEAERCSGVTGENLIVLLERRLDNVVYRLGFAASRPQSRQIVRHGHIILNGRKTDIPSCVVKSGDVISWREKSKKTEYFKVLIEEVEDRIVPGWLTMDKQEMIGRVVSLPALEDIEVKFNEKAIVEYYSR